MLIFKITFRKILEMAAESVEGLEMLIEFRVNNILRYRQPNKIRQLLNLSKIQFRALICLDIQLARPLLYRLAVNLKELLIDPDLFPILKVWFFMPVEARCTHISQEIKL